MSTEFSVISLGTGPSIDQTEGNSVSENASALVGLTFGGASNPLHRNVSNMSPAGSPGPAYDTDNSAANDDYVVDGTTYTADGYATYNATITYADGSTAVVELAITQTTTGEIFLLPPETGDTATQAILEAGPIESITFDSLVSNSGDMTADRQATQFDEVVDGTAGDDTMGYGSRDADGTAIGGGDDYITGLAGADTLSGAGGDDTILGGDGNDVIHGDMSDGTVRGEFEPTATANIDDSTWGGTSTRAIRAIELVELANGDLILVASERGTSDDGISTAQIDNDPSSATYGQVIGGRIDFLSESGEGNGYDDIDDMAATTLSTGETYVFTADTDTDTIGIAQINADGTLTALPPLTDNANLDEIQELSIAEVGGQSFLLALSGGGSDSLVSYQINSDGSLTQTDIEVDGSGAGENYLNNGVGTEQSLLESFTNSAGETFVISGGEENGIALWSLNSSGQLTFQNARGDDQAGSGESDPQGNDLGRDLVNPGNTGLNDVDAAAFFEVNGVTYIAVGGVDDDIDIFRLDADTVNGDGTTDLTLVGHSNNNVTDISSMAVMETDTWPTLIVGGEQSQLESYDLIVNGDGTVSLAQTGTYVEGTNGIGEVQDSEAIDVEDGLFVSASDNDNGFTIFDSGLTPENTADGNDSIDAGAGEDSVVAGLGDDTVLGGTGNDTIYGDTVEGEPVLGTELLTNATFAGNMNGWTTINPTGGSGPVYDSSVDGVRINQNDESVYGDGISQTVETVSGGTYDVSVNIGQNGGNGGDHTIVVEVLDDAGNVLDSQTVIVSNAAGGATVDLSFVATSDFSTLVITNPTSTATVGTDPLVLGASFVQTAHGDTQGGDDSIDGGEGADSIVGGSGSDTISLSDTFGNDTITAGEDNDGADIDVIDASGITASGVDVTMTGDEAGTVADGASTATYSEVESFVLTDQDDSFDASASNAAVTVEGLAGDDTIVAGPGDAVLSGGDDQDFFDVGFGNATIDGGEGGTDNDTISFATADDRVDITLTGDEAGTYSDVDGDSGSFTGIETFELSSSADSFDGSAATTGSATILAGAGNDTITGTGADDSIDGGTGDDSIAGGGGDDLFVYSGGMDTISDFNTGNSGALDDGDSTNNDSIDLSGYYDNIWELQGDYADDGILNQSNTETVAGKPVDYTDNTVFGAGEGIEFTGGAADGSFFTNENTGVVCFTPGTQIDTPTGPCLIEDLKIGDMVITRDNGPRRVSWIGTKSLTPDDLAENPKLKPILIQAGQFGLEQDLVVSPQHGILVKRAGDINDEVLVRAKHLTKVTGGRARRMHGRKRVTYIHVLFEDHQIIRANGCWSESLYLGPMAVASMSRTSLLELETLFPDAIAGKSDEVSDDTARVFLKAREMPLRMDQILAA